MLKFFHPQEMIFSKMIDGMVSPKAELSLRKHLEQCAVCKEKVYALGQVKTALQNLPALEENVIGQPIVPLTATPLVHSKGFPVWGVLVIGALAVFSFCLAVIPPPQPAMKVISSGLANDERVIEDTVRATSVGNVNMDLEVPDQFLLRLRPGTTITWQQTSRPWFGQKSNIIVNLMRGELLARTKENFWGSHLEIRTPMATTAVKGTALSVSVNPAKDETTLKVLAGTVFFSPYLKGVGVHVNAGQTSSISGQKLPIHPTLLAAQEKENLLETYRIGHGPTAALVIGGGPERVEELLNGALLYLNDRKDPAIQPVVRHEIQKLNAALLNGNYVSAAADLKILVLGIDSIEDHEIAIPLRLYAGAWAVRLNDPEQAAAYFRGVAETFPHHPMASLALTACGLIEKEHLNQPESARTTFDKVLSRYSKSPEALYLRDTLR